MYHYSLIGPAAITLRYGPHYGTVQPYRAAPKAGPKDNLKARTIIIAPGNKDPASSALSPALQGCTVRGSIQ